MSNYQKIISVIQAAKKPAILCHIRPDGDTLGAALGLKFALNTGADVYCDADISSYYDIVPGIETVGCNDFDRAAYDLLIAADCADASRLGKYKPTFLKHPNTVSIDHHKTNESFAKLNYVRPETSSAGELVFNLIRDAGFSLNDNSAVCLYIAVCTDTGNFTHSNTTPESYVMAAELLKHKVDVSYLNRKLYREMPYARLKLLSKTLETLKLHADGKIAVMDLSLKTLAECGCKNGDTEGFVEYTINTEGAVVGILLTELSRNSYKASLRSKPETDVSRAAAYFKGGGHKQAAGCIISGKLPDVIDKIVFECSKEIN